MVALRCTRIARHRLGLPDDVPEPPRSTGVLGDWYLHIVRFGRAQFAVATSERTLLTVLLPARELKIELAPRLRSGVGALLPTLGVSPSAIAREIATMEPVTFGRATNRRVLGSMNELAFQGSVYLARESTDLLAVAQRLSRVPMAAIGPRRGNLGFPDQVARELFAAYPA